MSYTSRKGSPITGVKIIIKSDMKKRKRIYISIPVTGRPMELVRIKAEEVKTEIRRRMDIPSSPLDLTEDNEPYTSCMGKCVEELLRCDAVYFVRGWQSSKGCTAEYAIAKIYGKELMFE